MFSYPEELIHFARFYYFFGISFHVKHFYCPRSFEAGFELFRGSRGGGEGAARLLLSFLSLSSARVRVTSHRSSAVGEILIGITFVTFFWLLFFCWNGRKRCVV